MSLTTGPILAMGAVTMANQMLLNDRPFDAKIPIGTVIAAGMFSLAEKVAPKGAQMLAWTAFAAVLLTRVSAGVPSPVESLAAWWRKQ